MSAGDTPGFKVRSWTYAERKAKVTCQLLKCTLVNSYACSTAVASVQMTILGSNRLPKLADSEPLNKTLLLWCLAIPTCFLLKSPVIE
jgi:hypothetical protein